MCIPLLRMTEATRQMGVFIIFIRSQTNVLGWEDQEEKDLKVAPRGKIRRGLEIWFKSKVRLQIERASAERQLSSPKRANPSPSMQTSQLPSFLDRMGMDLQERKHRLKVETAPTPQTQKSPQIPS